jgi:stress response protein YsnF
MTDPTQTGAPPEQSLDHGAGAANTVAVPLVEEEVRLSKRETVTGRVRVRTVVDSTEELVRQELDTEQVSVTRVPIDRLVDVAPAIRTEGDVTIIPVVEEILVVETKLVLKEEVHIRRTLTKETVEQSVTLRKQRAIVERDEV